MHTLIVIVIGFAMLAITVFASHWGGASVAAAALVFIPVWFLLALLNLWIGVSKAAYSVVEEIPVLLVVFAIPAVAAALISWRSSGNL